MVKVKALIVEWESTDISREGWSDPCGDAFALETSVGMHV